MQKRKTLRRPRRRKASTGDVLGPVVKPELIPARWKKYYHRLIALRESLLHSQGNLAEDAVQERPSFSMHMADAGTDSYDRDFALGMLSSEHDALYEIDQALDRIRNGTYGTCELTSKRIEAERLEAIPWARFSASAERQLEKEGARKRPVLGPRDTVAKAGDGTLSEPDEE